MIKTIAKVKNSTYEYMNRTLYGGNRTAVLERDHYTCQQCGMTNEEHKALWNKMITIDHINGMGYNSKVKDNRMENLVTLCLRCHGKKDIKRSPVSHAKPIYQLTLDGQIIRKLDSSTEAQRQLGIDRTYIIHALKGRNKTGGGFKWAYCDEKDNVVS